MAKRRRIVPQILLSIGLLLNGLAALGDIEKVSQFFPGETFSHQTSTNSHSMLPIVCSESKIGKHINKTRTCEGEITALAAERDRY